MPQRFQNFTQISGKFAKKKKKREKNLSIPLSKNRPVTGAMFLFCYFSFGSQSIPESSLINLSRYFCTDFSGVVFAYCASFSFPSGDIQIFTLPFVD